MMVGIGLGIMVLMMAGMFVAGGFFMHPGSKSKPQEKQEMKMENPAPERKASPEMDNPPDREEVLVTP